MTVGFLVERPQFVFPQDQVQGCHLWQEHRRSGAVSSCVLSGGPQVGFGPFIVNADLSHLIEIQPPFPPALFFSLQETDPILFILSGYLWEYGLMIFYFIQRVIVCYSHYSGAKNVEGWTGGTFLRLPRLLSEHILLYGTRRPGLVGTLPAPVLEQLGFLKFKSTILLFSAYLVCSLFLFPLLLPSFVLSVFV